MKRAPGSYSGLTHMQAELLSFLRHRDAVGNTPSFEEMREHLGQSSKSCVHRLMTGLKERGYIRYPYGRHRAIEVLAEREPFQPAQLPPLGLYSLSDLLTEVQRRGLRVSVAA